MSHKKSNNHNKYETSKQARGWNISSLKSKIATGIATLILAAFVYPNVIIAQDFSNYIKKVEGIRYTNLKRLDDSEALKEARKNHSKRQPYLNGLVNDSEIPYCGSLVYDHDGRKSAEHAKRDLIKLKVKEERHEAILSELWKTYKDGNFDGYTAGRIRIGKSEEPPTVFVGRLFFEDLKYNDGSIRLIIKDHETKHCEQISKGYEAVPYVPRNISLEEFMREYASWEALGILREAEALNNELNVVLSGNSNATPDDLDRIKSYLIKTYKELENIAKDSPLYKRSVIEEALKRLY